MDDRVKFRYVEDEVLPVDGGDKFDRLERWLKENGGSFPKLELRDYGNEVRGCHSKDVVENSETLMSIPLRCLITVEMGRETDLGRAIEAACLPLDAPRHVFLMLFILLERLRPDSFFRPYLDTLPVHMDNMPIFWQPHELDRLKGSSLLEQISERRRLISDDYKMICELDPSFSTLVSLHDFIWARMIVCSRNFGINLNGLQTAALVPYADMLNHYRPRETRWQFDSSVQSFTVVSLCELAAGAQVYDSYGRKCNHRFLLNYGFSIENNNEPNGFCPNEVPIQVSLLASDPLYQSKFNYYHREFGRVLRVSISQFDATMILLALLRIIVADETDFENISNAVTSWYHSYTDAAVVVSYNNELQMLTALEALCKQYLSEYPTTFDEDVALLSWTSSGISSGPSPNHDSSGESPSVSNSKSLDDISSSEKKQIDETQRLKSFGIWAKDKTLAELKLEFAPFTNARNALIQVRHEKEVLHHYLDFAVTSRKFLLVRSGEEFDSMLNEIRNTKADMIFNYCRSTIARLNTVEMRKLRTGGRAQDFCNPSSIETVDVD